VSIELAGGRDLEEAQRLHAEIVKGCNAIRRAWIYVAARLYRMHDDQAWKLLGHSTWGSYLASDDVGIARSYADLLVRAWRVLVVEGGMPPEQLDRTDLSKVGYVLPAVSDGRLEAGKAVVEARTLRREELRNLYVVDTRRDETVRRCPHCGMAL
jgi:hypothetical protein